MLNSIVQKALAIAKERQAQNLDKSSEDYSTKKKEAYLVNEERIKADPPCRVRSSVRF